MRIRVSVIVAVVGLVVACFTEPAAADGPEPAPAPSCIPADHCCRICEGGQACGKTCISRQKVCHVGHGCACDAAEVCH